MMTWQKYRKSPRLPSFLITFLLLVATLFMISTTLWYGYPNLYQRREVSYHRLPDYRNLPVDNNIQPLVEHYSEKFLNERSLRLRNLLNISFTNIVKGIPAKDVNWCGRMAEGKLDGDEHKKLEEWKFNITETINIINKGEAVDQKCIKLKEKFLFVDEPLSEEELLFPLAYGMLVYKSAFQVYMLISAIYQPQNIYCIIVDEKASQEFKNSMLLLTDCFPNIFVMESVGSIGWCEFGVARAVYTCLRYLTERDHKWKYFQYLSGFDLPLKTNLEMVRIFKQLNGAINMEVSLYQTGRLGKELENIKPPITLWKSSMSSLFPREAANEMIASSKVHELMRFLQYTVCSDEAIWATVAGNPQELKISGGFNASAFFNERTECVKNKKENNITAMVEQEVKLMANKHPNETFYPDNYYISRYQVWGDSKLHKCFGKWVSGSCVYGINDIPVLLKRPELVQHKMYFSYQPAAYFCLWKTIHERALDWHRQKEFKSTAYSQLPTVKYLREGKKKFFDEKCLLSLW